MIFQFVLSVATQEKDAEDLILNLTNAKITMVLCSICRNVRRPTMQV